MILGRAIEIRRAVFGRRRRPKKIRAPCRKLGSSAGRGVGIGSKASQSRRVSAKAGRLR